MNKWKLLTSVWASLLALCISTASAKQIEEDKHNTMGALQNGDMIWQLTDKVARFPWLWWFSRRWTWTWKPTTKRDIPKPRKIGDSSENQG